MNETDSAVCAAHFTVLSSCQQKGESFPADLDFANYTAAILAQVILFQAANVWVRSFRFRLASRL